MDTEETHCCPATYSPGYGTRQYSIVQRTRQGVRYFDAMWMPTNCHRLFRTKREATAFVKDHERRAFLKR